MGNKKKKRNALKRTPSQAAVAKERKTRQKKNNNDSDSDSDSDSASERDLRGIRVGEAGPNRMIGAVRKKKPVEVNNFATKLMEIEKPDLFENGMTLTNQECKALDDYFRRKAELFPNESIELGGNVRLEVIHKHDEGRFAGVYMVRMKDDDGKTTTMMLKTGIRNNNSVKTRINREFRTLKKLAAVGLDVKKKCPSYFHDGVMLGMPFFTMCILGPSMAKCQDEDLVTIQTGLYAAMEILNALTVVHCAGMVHRDIKPTNICSHPTGQPFWFLIDFGESIVANRRIKLGPPDGPTMPYTSVDGYSMVTDSSIPSTFKHDIEMWFYTFLETSMPLPWKNCDDPEESKSMKVEFWKDLPNSCAAAPAFLQIAQWMQATDDDNIKPPYTNIMAALDAEYRKGLPGAVQVQQANAAPAAGPRKSATVAKDLVTAEEEGPPKPLPQKRVTLQQQRPRTSNTPENSGNKTAPKKPSSKKKRGPDRTQELTQERTQERTCEETAVAANTTTSPAPPPAAGRSLKKPLNASVHMDFPTAIHTQQGQQPPKQRLYVPVNKRKQSKRTKKK